MSSKSQKVQVLLKNEEVLEHQPRNESSKESACNFNSPSCSITITWHKEFN
jgi:hypothetical protein